MVTRLCGHQKRNGPLPPGLIEWWPHKYIHHISHLANRFSRTTIARSSRVAASRNAPSIICTVSGGRGPPLRRLSFDIDPSAGNRLT